jgi:hypothetical protein
MTGLPQSIFAPRVAACLLLTLFSLTAVTPQESVRTLEWADHTNINTGRVDGPWSRSIDTIELEAILLDGKSILIGEPFVGDIRNLTFRVKNISEAPVSFIQITVTLPEIKRSPEIPFVSIRTDGRTEKPLMPGEEAELRIPDTKIYNWLKDAVVAQGRELPSIKKAAIYSVLVMVISAQEKQLVGGCLKTADLRNACRAAVK